MVAHAFPEIEVAPPLVRPERSLLLVDDDEVLVELLARRLVQQGFHVVSADSGQAAIELARAERPSAVILDLRLPDTDGLSVCEALVDSPDTCDIPVIILSGLESPDIIRKARAAGCQYFLRKPYDPNTLLLLIHQAIEDASEW